MQPKRNGNGHDGNGHNGNGRNALLKIVVLVLVVVLVAVLAWRLIDRWRGPAAEVWVAAADLQPGSLVADDDIERSQRRASNLPAGTLTRQEAIAGRLLGRAKQAGEPFVAGDFRRASKSEPDVGPGLAEILPEGRVLMEVLLPVENVVMDEFRRGDRLDILASRAQGERPRLVASDVFMIAFVDPNRARREAQREEAEGGGEAREPERQSLIQSLIQSTARPQRGGGAVVTRSTKLLLGLKPGDVVPLAEAQAAGATLAVVLHGKKEVTEGQLLTVQSPTWDVESIAGAARESVEFVQ